MNRLIEAYLRGRGLRYFRGRHDDEYFFLLAGADGGRLNVHLEVCGADGDTVQVSVSPDRYFLAESRDRLSDLAADWNAADPCALAVVHDSSDPALVGVMAYNCHRPGDVEALTDSVDRTVASATELFALVGGIAAPGHRRAG